MTDDRHIGPDDWDEEIARVDGPQLVVAGPGTGKTEFLVRRAVHLLDTTTVPPSGLLVLTFSRRGAADLRRRILATVARSTMQVAASTFHSFAVRLLESEVSRDGSGPPLPTLLTGPEQVALVADLVRTEEVARWPATQRPMLTTRTFAADVADFLMRAAERTVDGEQLEAMARERADWRALPALRARYLEELERRGRIDYGTLLSRAIDLARIPEVAERLADQYHYVLVDEYQDTSPAQSDLLDAVTRSRRNITVAGDPRQSIYGFRGADVGNVARFPGRFRDLSGEPARRIVLDTSFRVPAEILAAARRVAGGSELPGAADPIRPAPHPGAVDVHTFDQASAEAEWVAAEIERLHYAERFPYSSMAVLVRSTRHLLPELSRSLDRRRIPHDTPDTRLVDHPAVRLVFDLATAAVLAGDDDPLRRAAAEAPIRRLLLGPLVTMGIGAERSLRRDRIRTDSTWVDALASNETTAPLASLIADPTWATDQPAVDGFWHAWDRAPALTQLALDPARTGDRAAWTALAQALEQQRERDPSVSLEDYRRSAEEDDFEATPLLSHRPTGDDRLTLTTLHQAKGLEFEVVFISDATEDVFPDLRRGFNPLDPQALGGPADRSTWLVDRLEEETRLAYTAMTRARTRVVMTATTAGIDEDERRPSRFLLAAAGVATVDDLPAPPSDAADVLTSRGLQTWLRRRLMDPAVPVATRLAAASVLASGGEGSWDPDRFAGVRPPGPDRGILSRTPRLSPSQAESYQACPRRYVFERRLAMTDTSSPYARYGTLVHAVLERADRAALAAGRARSEIEDALEALHAVWDEQADFGSAWLDAIWLAKAETLLHRLFDEWPLDTAGTVAAEHPLRHEIEGLEWVGRADRIESLGDGSLRVVDYKTSSSIMSKQEAAVSLQLAFYALAASADPAIDGEISAAELWYPATTLKDFRRALDMDRLPEVAETMVEIGRRILAEDWEPTPGPTCDRCSVRIVCPEWPEGREAFTG